MEKIIVDPRDEWILEAFHFYLDTRPHTIYARAHVPNSGAKGQKMYLHHCIVGRPLGGLEVDHRNRNGLDNRRCNLRVVTKSVNMLNGNTPCTNTSGYRGVLWHERTGKWLARIKINGKQKHLGLFATAKEASNVYEDCKK